MEIWIDINDYGQRVFKEKYAKSECKAGESAKSKQVITSILGGARLR